LRRRYLVRPLPPISARAPAVASPAYNWSGWYGGVNAGWVGGSGGASNDATIVSTSDAPGNAEAMALGATNAVGSSSGFIGGGQFGYNYQLSSSFVAGFEADIQGLSGAHKQSSSAVSLVDAGENVASIVTNSTITRDLSYLGTVRARVGVLVAPSFLLYATGGLAYGGAKSETTIAQSVTNTANPPPPTLTSGAFSGTRIGYAVGAGGEWMLSSNWSAKLEYLYYDLGSATYATGGVANNVGPTSLQGFGTDAIATSTKVRFNDNIVRVGVNYHFGGLPGSQY
jgi:outer membrane immunogenic protein